VVACTRGADFSSDHPASLAYLQAANTRDMLEELGQMAPLARPPSRIRRARYSGGSIELGQGQKRGSPVREGGFVAPGEPPKKKSDLRKEICRGTVLDSQLQDSQVRGRGGVRLLGHEGLI
jgi:hypothetical protein